MTTDIHGLTGAHDAASLVCSNLAELQVALTPFVEGAPDLNWMPLLSAVDAAVDASADLHNQTCQQLQAIEAESFDLSPTEEQIGIAAQEAAKTLSKYLGCKPTDVTISFSISA